MFYGSFSSKEDICNEFKCNFDGDVLHADYENEDYDGSARVLFTRDGKLFYVEGGHCSCYGLEDQWDEEELSLAMILHLVRGGKHSFWGNHQAVADALALWEQDGRKSSRDEWLVLFKLGK
jgi:hypothetical protein